MENITYQGRIIEVVEKVVEQDGKERVFEYARRSPGVRIIIPKNEQILLSKEFRHEVNGYDYRLPGGKVFDTLDEYNAALSSGTDIAVAAKQAAVKEAKEEVGAVISDLTQIHRSVCGATIEWDLFYFLANEFELDSQDPEDGEDITVEFLDKEKVRVMCLDGSIGEERSALVLLRYLTNN